MAPKKVMKNHLLLKLITIRHPALYFIIIGFFFVSSCIPSNPQPVKEISDTVLLGTQTCNLPCWENITPGVTHIDEAIEKLRDAQLRGGGKLDLGSSTNSIEWADKNSQSFSLIYVDNLITQISYKVNFEANQIRLDEILNHFGNPSGVSPVLAPHPGGDAHVRIYYPAKGLILLFRVEKQSSITPNMPLVEVELVSTTDGHEELFDIYLLSFGKPTPTGRRIPIDEWPGYGEIPR